MIRSFLILISLFLITPLFATEQEPERLALNGKEYGMQYLPLYELDTLLQKQIYKRAGVYDKYEESTGLWRGYVGYWSIQDDYLYLDSILVCMDHIDGKDIYRVSGYDELKDLLPMFCHDGRIRADWVTDDSVLLVDHTSERLFYAHMGFSSTFSREILCSFRSGFLRRLEYRNHLFHKGAPWKECINNVIAAFPFDQYPELKDRGSLYIIINDIQVDEDGHLTDCKLSIGGLVLRGLENEAELTEKILDWAKRQILLQDWTVYEYNGKYTFCYWAQQFDLNFGWKRKDKVKIS